ncbi:fumarylacetoacetate hydrolase family protein [Burkholderia sp. MR1-5-21]
MSKRRQFMATAATGLAAAAFGQPAKAAAPGYAIPPLPVPSLPVARSSERFPVRRIYCMGLNYDMHIKESSFRAPPFYFMKASDQIVENKARIPYPRMTHNYHHEIEMVVAIGRGGADIPVETALDHVFGYALGLDMTRRDLQTDALKAGMPWEAGKSFDQAAPCTALHRVADVDHIRKGRIDLKVNGEIRQQDDVGNMLLDVPHIINLISKSQVLMPGDLIYTGTPAGPGPVVSGDRMVGTLEGIGELTITIA